MKSSKLLNENKKIGKLAYRFFKIHHKLSNYFSKKSEFNLLGDTPPKFYVPYHPNPESNLYGHIEVLKQYLKNDLDLINLHIQHGVILGNLVQEIMINSFADTLITFSENRKKLIQKNIDKKILAIGPYIRYAKNRLSQEKFEYYKKKYGKTLLVFPAHSSVDRTKLSFDQIDLVKKVKEIAEKHDIKTVFINLFYNDCNKDKIDFYEQEGFKVCSSGYWLSENFLPNLRTIIELSDITMSNKVGTHIGYCISLNKPHYIYIQNYDEEYIGIKGLEDLNQLNDNKYFAELDSDRIESVFLNDDFIITKDQIDIVNEFWGNDIYYSQEELINLLS